VLWSAFFCVFGCFLCWLSGFCSCVSFYFFSFSLCEEGLAVGCLGVLNFDFSCVFFFLMWLFFLCVLVYFFFYLFWVDGVWL